jgi:hypothetical protein
MRTIGGLVLAFALVATGLALWSSSNTLAKQSAGMETSAPIRTISAREIHGRINIKNLPTQGRDEDAI